MRLRPKTLCVFDVMYSRGIKFMRELSKKHFDEIFAEIKHSARLFGNLGLDLTEAEIKFIYTKIIEAAKSGFFNEIQSLTNEFYVHDFYAPKSQWQEFRNSFE